MNATNDWGDIDCKQHQMVSSAANYTAAQMLTPSLRHKQYNVGTQWHSFTAKLSPLVVVTFKTFCWKSAMARLLSPTLQNLPSHINSEAKEKLLAGHFHEGWWKESLYRIPVTTISVHRKYYSLWWEICKCPQIIVRRDWRHVIWTDNRQYS